jgi:hypothetical protein
VLQKNYNCVTKELQLCYKDKKMKARKSIPKSIRFNIKDFDAGMIKGKFESAQDMVDYLLKNYAQPQKMQTEQISKTSVSELPPSKNQTKGDLLKLIRDGKI